MRFQKILIAAAALWFCSCNSTSTSKLSEMKFEEYPVYPNYDLGLSFNAEQATLKVYAPTAEKLVLRCYSADLGGIPIAEYPMQKGEMGIWSHVFETAQYGQYYTVQATIDGKEMNEVAEPYAVALGANGVRAQIVNPEDLSPENWSEFQYFNAPNIEQAILYELHIRDASIHPQSGVVSKGKYLGLSELNTTDANGLPTALNYISQLGVTHVHLLPTFDFKSLDETVNPNPKYNWGYDPLFYNVPEGSYSSNAHDGSVRIKEFKQMVAAFHQKGLGVIMDVVYNHTGPTLDHPFNQLVPGYYYRQNKEGKFSDASGCGNEIASERPMVRNFIIQSLLHWQKVYGIDGFRFDLMGIHDIFTMREIKAALAAQNPNVVLYGEGWTAAESPLADSLRALKKNTAMLNGVAAFSDDMRDGLKGSVFEHHQKGWVSGNNRLRESVKFGIAGNVSHPQVKMDSVNYSKVAWAESPKQSVNYASCHDNHTLYDRLVNANPKAKADDILAMQRLALASVLLSMGTPFLHAGSEFLRSKQGVENSYESADSINQINWNNAAIYRNLVSDIQALVALRKQWPHFAINDAKWLAANLKFIEDYAPAIIYQISHSSGLITVALNNAKAIEIADLDAQTTKVLYDSSVEGSDGSINAVSAMGVKVWLSE